MKPDPRTIFVLLAIVVAVAATEAPAKELYRWTDENGVVHFSDKKPPGNQAYQSQVVTDEAPVPAEADSPAVAEGEAEAEALHNVAQQRREEIARKKQEARQEQAERSTQCAAWQAEVDRLEPSRRVYYTNEAGETERMDDVQRVETVARLKEQIAANCR